jgi:hypothetical protein
MAKKKPSKFIAEKIAERASKKTSHLKGADGLPEEQPQAPVRQKAASPAKAKGAGRREVKEAAPKHTVVGTTVGGVKARPAPAKDRPEHKSVYYRY